MSFSFQTLQEVFLNYPGALVPELNPFMMRQEEELFRPVLYLR
jgi:hypothetical protein